MLSPSAARVSVRLAASVTALGCAALLAGCGNSAEAEEQARQARMTVDDSAHPIGPGQPTLTGSFDVATKTLAEALPKEALRANYTELQEMGAETLTPSEASGCNPDLVSMPSLPATEVLATKAAAVGKQQPDIANIVAARASDEESVDGLIKAVRSAARGCAKFSTAGRDLGEGSYAPGEKGSTTIVNQAVGSWAGLRMITPVTVTGANWTQKVVRESLVLRRGQVVVHVRVETADEASATARVDELMGATLTNIERLVNAPAGTAAGSTGSPSQQAGSASPTEQPTVRSSEAASIDLEAGSAGDQTATATSPSPSESTTIRSQDSAQEDSDSATPVSTP